MHYRVNPALVSHDRLHDEVIVINTGSGAYYSGSGTAADIWTLVSQGASVADASSILAVAYESDQSLIIGQVDECVATLLARGLIEQAEGRAEAVIPSLPEGVRSAWAAPSFDEYTDMWELIKLDPIHEVDEVGWPIAKA